MKIKIEIDGREIKPGDKFIKKDHMPCELVEIVPVVRVIVKDKTKQDIVLASELESWELVK
jgi:hypothetical protein